MSQSFCHAAFVALATNRLNELTKFYEALLQTPPSSLMADRYAEFAIAGLKLALFQPQATHQSEFAQPDHAAMSLCLEVANLEAAIAHLTHLGYAPPEAITTASHGREVYAYDPDGNRLILHQSS
ncbi:VOC family protein [Leptolyngbya iicbica]|uniref:Glyoxalase/bleomycin resistance/dioxygenase family protein n=2 Tax=Cyanophyceae TaxID=3028117 RepID=A0A4Q7E186_9CYAN|nr:VOC family protein [Leptolyngbya sp. LK]RZM74705.1 glyoxalase/bleomycin resistance/dioxygenase family protein [Leptolyngbya sp. LK]